MRHESDILQTTAAELDALQLTAEDLQTLAEIRHSMESGELRVQLDQMHTELDALDQSDGSGAGGADQ